jgi:hypothetical protein
VTGAGPFGVLECRSCSYGVTAPQLRGSELLRYYGADYFEGFYGHDEDAPRNRLERARERGGTALCANPIHGVATASGACARRRLRFG